MSNIKILKLITISTYTSVYIHVYFINLKKDHGDSKIYITAHIIDAILVQYIPNAIMFN